MIGVKKLTDKVNALIEAGNLTQLQITQLLSVENSLSNSKYVVDSAGSLPDASTNEGILVYVADEDEFYYSQLSEWTNVFNSSFSRTANIYSLGDNFTGELGDNTRTFRSSPVTAVGGITNWSQVSAGALSVLAVTDTGIAYSWGGNGSGQLGNGTVIARSSPGTVIGGITNWSQVDAGQYHNISLTDTGIAYAWGNNQYGQLGDNTRTFRSSPVTVVGGITNWSQVSAGQLHCLGLTDAGIAYGWGYSNGAVGDGTRIARSSPVTVTGGITNWSQVSAGRLYSLGLTDSGIAYGWGGANVYGQIGDGSNSTRSSPATVVGGITNWSQVSAGTSHSAGVTSSGIAYAWGRNVVGQLGTNSRTQTNSPVTVVGGITNWSQVATGGTINASVSIGLTDAGVAYGWGNNFSGELGDGTNIQRSSPVTIVGGITNWSQVSSNIAVSSISGNGRPVSTLLEAIVKGFNEQ